VARLKSMIRSGAGPLFAQVKIDAEKLPLVLPPRDATHIKNVSALPCSGRRR